MEVKAKLEDGIDANKPSGNRNAMQVHTFVNLAEIRSMPTRSWLSSARSRSGFITLEITLVDWA